MRLSTIYGGLTLASLCVSCLAYSPFGQTLERENHPRSTVDHQVAGFDWSREETGTEAAFQVALAEEEKATSLAAVGWKGCHWCEKFKTDTLPSLVAEGYDVRYVDIAEWKGPKVKTGPTLFFFVDRDKIVKVHKGFLMVDQVKEYLRKPSLK